MPTVNPVRPTFSRLVAAVAALTLAAGLLGACSGDDQDPADAEASTSAADSAVATLIQTGLDQLAAADEKSARATFTTVLSLDADNVYGHYNLGLIEQRAGRDDHAAEQYDAALATDPEFAPALYNRGILAESTDLDEAVELYRRTVDADPKFAAAFMRLGFALVHLGQDDEGAKFLGKGVSLDPSMADVEAPSYD